MSLFWAYLLLEVCRKAILEWRGVLFLLWCSHCRVIQARMLDLRCCAIQFLLTFSWTCPMRKLQFAHGCTLRMCQGTSDPFSKLLVSQSILLRCIAITPPACKEWELMHVNAWEASLAQWGQLLWLPVWLQCWFVWFEAHMPCLRWSRHCWWLISSGDACSWVMMW
jgi:hypothetical protein